MASPQIELSALIFDRVGGGRGSVCATGHCFDAFFRSELTGGTRRALQPSAFSEWKDQLQVGHTIHPSDSGRQASERPPCCHKESGGAYLLPILAVREPVEPQGRQLYVSETSSWGLCGFFPLGLPSFISDWGLGPTPRAPRNAASSGFFVSRRCTVRSV
jgi:hypothetical protein